MCPVVVLCWVDADVCICSIMQSSCHDMLAYRTCINVLVHVRSESLVLGQASAYMLHMFILVFLVLT